ncbi:MAG: hypothetical protein KI790_02705 [Cyclobacteriaceae bacterium]|nr:hypothetical protein [Cyclobacteriaceae bacterium HetDA_MAG_MS6]
MSRQKLVLALCFICAAYLSFSQDSIPLIHSTKVIQEGIRLHDKEKFDEAIQLYESIPTGDTNYMWVQSELLFSLIKQEEYAKAIRKGEIALQSKNEYQAHFFVGLGNAYDLSGQPQKSIATYLKGLSLFPYHQLLHYNLAKTYFDQEQYPEACRSAQKSLMVNPFHTNSHYLLGKIMILTGQRTKAMLSLLTFLAIKPGDNGTLVLLENLVNNALREEGSIEPFDGNMIFESLDAILKSKATDDPRFVSEIDFGATIVKKTELLFDILRYDDSSHDFWMRCYSKYLVELHQKGHKQAFIYLILLSTKKEAVEKWRDAHQDKTKAMISQASEGIRHFRESHRVEIGGIEAVYKFWYFDNGKLNAIGNKNDELKVGPWLFLYGNGQPEAIGSYDNQGNYFGDWRHYYPNGQLQKVATYDQDGNIKSPVIFYHETGKIANIIPYVNNEIHGQLEIYYRCGQLKELLPYVSGINEGKGEIFHDTGENMVTYEMKAGQLNGAYSYLFPDGTVKEQYHYVNGTLEGAFIAYYKDGSVRQQGSYAEGQDSGDWSGLYNNGKPQYQGQMKQGKRVGEWRFYNENGQLTDIERYNDQGQKHGDQKSYLSDGELRTELRYNADTLIGYRYYSRNGRLIDANTLSNGNLHFRAYHANGKLQQSKYFKQGKVQGLVEEYHSNGILKSKIIVEDGSWQGNYVEYDQKGNLSYTSQYINGRQDGYYIGYYSNGAKSLEGWIKDGKQVQTWRSYFISGTISEEYYYQNDVLHGDYTVYAPDGVIFQKRRYDEGQMVELNEYDSLGQLIHTDAFDPAGDTIIYHYPGGAIKHSEPVACGKGVGNEKDFYPNGSVMGKKSLSHGQYQEEFAVYQLDGSLEQHGGYESGKPNGNWKWFEEGSLSVSGRLKEGKRHGKWQWYHDNGALETSALYYEGDLTDTARRYDNTGALAIERLYLDGQPYAYRYELPDGSFKVVELSEDFSGHVTAYFKNGMKSADYRYKNGFREGEVVFFHSNGKIYEKYSVKNGDNEGVRSIYYRNGQLKSVTPFHVDEEHGLQQFYYPNGQVRKMVNWKLGRKHGVETIYSKTGEILKKTNYWNNEIYQ